MWSFIFWTILSLLHWSYCDARPNFLMIVCDDLGPYVGPYVAEDHPMNGKTPNIQKLVDNGDTFLFTSVQQPVCGPSRASFLSGRYPDTTKIFNFEKFLFEVSEKILTIPKYFKQNLGYYTAAFGKVFHPYYQGDIDLYYEKGHWSQPTKAYDHDGNSECFGRELYCSNLPQSSLTDAKVANEVVQFIDERAKKKSIPWLAVVGFRRPHDSFAAPQWAFNNFRLRDLRMYDFYDETQPNIENMEFRDSLAYYECRKMDDKKILFRGRRDKQPIRSVKDLHKHKVAIRKIRQSYFASIHWVDTRVGIILNKLESHGLDKNTVILFFGDHGFQMGEKQIWCKNTLYENAVRTPLIISIPGLPQGSVHRTPTQLIDIFPTLIDLAGKNSNSFDDLSGYGLDGVSLQPVLFDEYKFHHAAAYSQYPRCVCDPDREIKEKRSCPVLSNYLVNGLIEKPKTIQFHPCSADQRFDANSCSRPKIIWMGYSIRTSYWKYVEWRPFNEVRGECKVGYFNEPTADFDHIKSDTDWNADPIERELYDLSHVTHLNGPNTETKNLVLMSKYSKVVSDLSNMIKLKFTASGKICSNHGIQVLDNKNKNGKFCNCTEGWEGDECDKLVSSSVAATNLYNAWFGKMVETVKKQN